MIKTMEGLQVGLFDLPCLITVLPAAPCIVSDMACVLIQVMSHRQNHIRPSATLQLGYAPSKCAQCHDML